MYVQQRSAYGQGGRKYQEAWFLHGSRFCGDARRFCRVGCLRDLVCGYKRCFCRFFRCRDVSQWRVRRYPKRTVPGHSSWVFRLSFLCGISRNISRGVSPFTKTHVRLIRVLALAFAVNAAVSLVGAYGSVNLTIGGLELYIVPHSFVIEICQGATFDAGSFIGAVVCLFISAIWSYASLLQEQSDELV